MKYEIRNMKKGLSVIELLVGVAIISILIISVLVAMRLQLSRSRDAVRKTDLEKIKVAFEDYYNDNGCYPPETVLDDCGSDIFVPYLAKIPCDPTTKTPYVYLPLEGSACKGYRVLTALEDSHDPVVKKLGCDSTCGCGYGISYNYGVSVGVDVASGACAPLASPVASVSPAASPAGGSPAPSGSPSSSTIYVYACDNTGVCNRYAEGHSFLAGCPRTFATPQLCAVGCQDQANWCN